MKRKLPQTPEAFESDLRRLIQALGHLAHEYRWAYGTAYSKQVVDSVPARTKRSMAQPDTSALTDEGKRVLFEHRSVREAMKEADAAIERIRKAMQRDEARHGELFDPLRFPVTVLKAEVQELGEAKIRRRQRGEWSPL